VARFQPEALERLERAQEIRIEAGTRKTIIWIVTVDGEVYVRSVRGIAGRWYRTLLRRPTGAVHVGRERYAMRAIPEERAEVIARVTAAFAHKYARSSVVRSMLTPASAAATLRVEPERETS